MVDPPFPLTESTHSKCSSPSHSHSLTLARDSKQIQAKPSLASKRQSHTPNSKSATLPRHDQNPPMFSSFAGTGSPISRPTMTPPSTSVDWLPPSPATSPPPTTSPYAVTEPSTSPLGRTPSTGSPKSKQEVLTKARSRNLVHFFVCKFGCVNLAQLIAAPIVLGLLGVLLGGAFIDPLKLKLVAAPVSVLLG